MTDNKPTVSKTRTRRIKKNREGGPVWYKRIPATTWLLLIVLWASMMTILHLGREVQLPGLTPGQRAPTTVQALVDFETIDLAETELRREQAANEVPPVFVIEGTALTQHQREWTKLVDRMQMLMERTAGASNRNEQLESGFGDAVDLMGLPPELAVLPTLLNTNDLERIGPLVSKSMERQWKQGILSAANKSTRFQGSVPGGTIQLGIDGPVRELSSFVEREVAVERILEEIHNKVPLKPDVREPLKRLLHLWIGPNLILNQEQTALKRDSGRKQVEPVVTTIREGTTLMEARARVTEQMLENLRLHGEKLLQVEDGRTLIFKLMGHGILLLCAIGTSLLILVLFAPECLLKPGRTILWITLSAMTLLLAKFLTYAAGDMQLIPAYMIRSFLPFAFAPLLATILRGPGFAVAVGLTTSMGLSLAFGLSNATGLAVFVSGLTITVVAAISARAIRKRSNLFRAGLLIGGVKAFLVLGMGVLLEIGGLELAQQVAGGFLSGLLMSVLVLLLIPPFEVLFKVTTDIRLLELSDMSHPLLSRLALEAPGTYHHSLMVAQLAQAAAREIDADDLLVRVCAYYHDIGKMTKPDFFIENSESRVNPHDDLNPSMSRLVIISHVKEGVSLAHTFKLPQIIVNGIEQHHGTSVIQYFYHRAKQQKEADHEVRPEDFRYPGPKPRTKEMGILLLADSVEAASRSIDKNKPGQIEGLIEEIFREKVQDGQLDQCGMTFGELARVKRSFIFSLNNMLHGRIAYPKDEDRDHESAGTPPA